MQTRRWELLKLPSQVCWLTCFLGGPLASESRVASQPDRGLTRIKCTQPTCRRRSLPRAMDNCTGTIARMPETKPKCKMRCLDIFPKSGPQLLMAMAVSGIWRLASSTPPTARQNALHAFHASHASRAAAARRMMEAQTAELSRAATRKILVDVGRAAKYVQALAVKWLDSNH